MSQTGRGQAEPIRLRIYVWVLVIFWTIAFVATLTWELVDEWNKTRDVLRAEARSAFRKDRGLLRWYAAHGGVFVPATGKPPTDRGEREGDVLSGQVLMPVDASDMIREVHEFGHEESDLRSHLVGLEPRHPANAPDAWEADALKRLAEGEPAVSSEQTIRGETFLQIMRPLIVETSCLKCHAEQRYRAGELRGAIHISVPLAPAWPLEKTEMVHRVLGYGGMWLVGLLGILIGARQLRRQIVQRAETEKALRRREGPDDCGTADPGTSSAGDGAEPHGLRPCRGNISSRVRKWRLLRLHSLVPAVLCDRCSATSPGTGLAPHCSWHRYSRFCISSQRRATISARSCPKLITSCLRRQKQVTSSR